MYRTGTGLATTVSNSMYVVFCVPGGKTGPIPVMCTAWLGRPLTGLVTYAPQHWTSCPFDRLKGSRIDTYEIGWRFVMSRTLTNWSQTARPPVPAETSPRVV